MSEEQIRVSVRLKPSSHREALRSQGEPWIFEIQNSTVKLSVEYQEKYRRPPFSCQYGINPLI